MNPHHMGADDDLHRLVSGTLWAMILITASGLILFPAYGSANIISPGDQVFLGEEGLDISAAVPGNASQIAWFAPGSNINVDVPALILTIGSKQNFYVSPSQFGHATGTWYVWNQTAGAPAFEVLYPSLNLRVWNQDTNQDVSGTGVPPGTLLNFRIETNMYSITRRAGYDPASDGYLSIMLTSPGGATLSAVAGPNSTSIPIRNLNVNTLPWYWASPGTGTGWDTGATGPAGTRLYQAGTYTASLDYNVNRLQDNLQGVPGTGRPMPVQVRIASDRVAIASNVADVVRGNPFSVTINGVPGAEYYLWVRNTGSMAGDQGSQPPMITPNQEGVRMDPEGGPFSIGSHPVSTRQGMTIRDDVPNTPANGTRYYAQVTLPGSGTRTVQWQTSSATDSRSYTFRVERTSAGMLTSSEVTVDVVRGTISLSSGPSRSYYLGEQVTLSGTNTESDTVYLFMTGPNLPSSGGSLSSPRTSVITGRPETFTSVPVDPDNTWEYRWFTGNLGVDAGSYTVYVVSGPSSRSDLRDRRYSTVSISFSRPFVTAGIREATIARGDKLEIRGTATGNPSPGVAVWIFGINRVLYTTQAISADGSFSYELSEGQTSALSSGQYYVVVQHPGYTNTLDIYPDPARQVVLSTYPVTGSPIFRMSGAGSLMSAQAANALIDALDSPFIDDTYTTTTFLLVNPQITIAPLVNPTLGDKITLSGTTNLAPGNRLLVEVTSQSFGPTPKVVSSEFSGAAGTIIVQDGPGDMNTWSFTFDTASLVPDTYTVRVSGVTVSGATATTSFNLVTPTPTPTATPTVTSTPTSQPTTMPTTIPTTQTGLSLVTLIGGLCLCFTFGMGRRRG